MSVMAAKCKIPAAPSKWLASIFGNEKGSRESIGRPSSRKQIPPRFAESVESRCQFRFSPPQWRKPELTPVILLFAALGAFLRRLGRSHFTRPLVGVQRVLDEFRVVRRTVGMFQ